MLMKPARTIISMPCFSSSQRMAFSNSAPSLHSFFETTAVAIEAFSALFSA